ncbi:hypothetical protein GH714_003759 [Hevea brasiliensis]|uniref:Uncharacterized protein n=1 Tax=Hevea brasiliensis TaxID=3981 RepID=A0A6A6KN68_HEVBR|nr:hypothetical protein GH714_003759 [Hevea brasiliensis]
MPPRKAIVGRRSLKDKGNEFFKAGNYLKAAALYTQAIKLDLQILLFIGLGCFPNISTVQSTEHESEKIGSEECCKEIFSFLVETMEAAVKSWHETSNVDPRVYFLIDKEKTETDKYAPVVNIDKAFDRLIHTAVVSHFLDSMLRRLSQKQLV